MLLYTFSNTFFCCNNVPGICEKMFRRPASQQKKSVSVGYAICSLIKMILDACIRFDQFVLMTERARVARCSS